MRTRGVSHGSLLAGALALCALVVALAAAGVFAGGDGPGAAVRLVQGVPVGVRDTPAGALAASDNYVALAAQSIEQDPGVFAVLVAQAYTPSARARALEQARALRAGDAQNMGNYGEGGRGLAVVAARRLDGYTPAAAMVATWLGGFVWGPRLAPRQTWDLVDTALRWQGGRWLVASSQVQATPAPVPSIVYVQGDNNTAAAFARLAGMSAPFYGTAG
jgi:hypothetical protein